MHQATCFYSQKLLTTVSSHNLLRFINFQTIDEVVGFPLWPNKYSSWRSLQQKPFSLLSPSWCHMVTVICFVFEYSGSQSTLSQNFVFCEPNPSVLPLKSWKSDLFQSKKKVRLFLHLSFCHSLKYNFHLSKYVILTYFTLLSLLLSLNDGINIDFSCCSAESTMISRCFKNRKSPGTDSFFGCLEILNHNSMLNLFIQCPSSGAHSDARCASSQFKYCHCHILNSF